MPKTIRGLEVSSHDSPPKLGVRTPVGCGGRLRDTVATPTYLQLRLRDDLLLLIYDYESVDKILYCTISYSLPSLSDVWIVGLVLFCVIPQVASKITLKKSNLVRLGTMSPLANWDKACRH